MFCDWLFIGGPMSLPQMLLSNKSVERRHFPQTITATSSHKRVIGHSSWWEIDHLGSLWGYQISLGLGIICRYVLLSWFPSDQKARIGLCGVSMEYRRKTKAIQALPSLLVYQSSCHVSSEGLGRCHVNPTYPLKGPPYRFSPHELLGIASSPEVFFASKICGNPVGPRKNFQSQNLNFIIKKKLNRLEVWAPSYN